MLSFHVKRGILCINVSQTEIYGIIVDLSRPIRQVVKGGIDKTSYYGTDLSLCLPNIEQQSLIYLVTNVSFN